ncbi:primary active transporter [Lithospermum erythrorhizon]|uniref:Peroxisomal membrane protein PEX14 n=1 Tax=Lithospermum erythrorhizon TaxID=34254 RepID=A0AAV3QLJ7_LITER
MNKPQNPDSLAQPAAQVNEDDKTEPVKETSPTSVFVNSEPIREDQVQNAVKFLSHPKVKGSPVIYRRSFLEKKGLTKEEIDEAFRRVPDPTPSVSSTQTAVADQDGQQKSSSGIKNGAPGQTVSPSNLAPTGRIARKRTFSNFHWSHALLAVSVLAISGAGTAVLIKSVVIPKFKSWIRKIVFEEEEEGPPKRSNLTTSFAEEAASAAKAAAAAASDVARASQEMLLSNREDKKYFEDLTKLLDIQVHEIKSMNKAIQKMEGKGNASRNTQIEFDDYRVSAPASRLPQQSYTNGKVDVDSRSVRSSSPSASAESSAPPHPKSYMEIMAMVQRGEKPSNIREIDDMPPNPNQPIPNPRVAPKPKPWEVSQTPYTSSNVFQPPQGNGNSNAELRDNQLNGTSTAPWWQQKNGKISEIETEDEQKMGSSGVLSTKGPVPRSWAPPTPPPVAMAEAAAAIRQPKRPQSQKEQLTDDQLLSQSSNASDELQRITKISEAGGFGEANGGSSGPLINEMLKGEENTYLEA